MSATRTPRTSTHLTLRGRVLVVLGLVALLYAAFSLGRAGSQASDAHPERAAQQLAEVTVEPGESLWTLARRTAPRHDPRDVVRQIKDLNDLADADLRVGQRLRLPVAA